MALSKKWQWTKQLMQEDENTRGDTFEWNIPRFLKNDRTILKSFRWGKYSCWLSIKGTVTDNIYSVYLRCDDPSFFQNLHFYKLSVINRQLQIFLSTSGNHLAVFRSPNIQLLRFSAGHFMNYSEEDLTICLSLNTWTDKGAEEKNTRTTPDLTFNTWTGKGAQEKNTQTTPDLTFNTRTGKGAQEKISQTTPDLAFNTWTDKGAQDKNTQTTPDLTSDEKPPNFLETLSNDFGRLYDSGTNTDCVLRVGPAEFSAHRAVLSARSTVFADLFVHGTSESSSGIVDILEVDSVVISDVLYFIYTGQIRGLTTNACALMCDMANKFCLMDLKEECLDFLKHNLNVGNVCDAALLAHDYEETELEEKVAQFMNGRLDEIKESVEWKTFSHYKPSLSSKLLDSASAKKHKKMRFAKENENDVSLKNPTDNNS